MSDEQRKYRFLEIEPLKNAIMEAHGRALDRRPPLHTRAQYGHVPWTGLEHAIKQLSMDDRLLHGLCEVFLQACGRAGNDWFSAVHALEPGTSFDAIVRQYDQHHDGKRHLAEVDDAYTKLSRYLETLLA